MLRSTLLRLPRASSSRSVRSLSSSAPLRRDILSEFEEQITPRELVERKRKEFEAKYADKLKSKIEAEGASNLEELKEKVKTPSVLAKIKAQEWAKEEAERAAKAREAEEAAVKEAKESKTTERKVSSQGKGDRAGVKPLGSIINLPLILMTPHDGQAIADIWNTYHTTHPTLANSFLSATLPAETYDSMISLAKRNPFFVLPLPRDNSNGGEAFEMFYMQWLFHPPPAPLPDANATNAGPLPPVTSVIFTPLAEFKNAGEWAQPFLTLTHYPDLAHSHGNVLMRGEITAQTATGPQGSLDNPGFLLSQQQAQLLTLALQRFYCADMAPPNETSKARDERLQRAQALIDFREKPQDWNWENLVTMAYGGLA